MQQYYGMPQQPQQPQPQRETVTLPADAYPGKQYDFTAQNGRSVTFSVPAGMGPGSQVSVDVGAQHMPAAQQQYVAFQDSAPAQPQPPQPQRETVTLPADAYPGKQYDFTAQNGRCITFSVPAGMGPGSQVSVDVGAQHMPAAQPQHMPAAQQQYEAPAQRGTETVVLPADAYPGKQYDFTAASGKSLTFSVPAGMGPGDSLTITY